MVYYVANRRLATYKRVMPKIISSEELETIASVIAARAEGIGADGIRKAVYFDLPARTLQRRLAVLLVEDDGGVALVPPPLTPPPPPPAAQALEESYPRDCSPRIISACSSSLRKRAAVVAPPATPPTIIYFAIFLI